MMNGIAVDNTAWNKDMNVFLVAIQLCPYPQFIEVGVHDNTSHQVEDVMMYFVSDAPPT